MILINTTTLLILLTSYTVRCTRTVVNATVGDKVTLPCHTDLPFKVDWRYKQRDTTAYEEDYIFIGGNRGVYWQHHNRTELNVAAGDYNLTIYSLTLNDTGAYTCVEDEGIGNKHPFWLQVYARRDERLVSTTVGSKVVLRCHTDFPQPVDWKYKLRDGAEEIFIFSNGSKGIWWPSYDRTELATNAGDYDLILNKIIVSDTGLYTCVEKMGNRTKHSFWLQVHVRRIINATVGDKYVTLPCHTEHSYPVDWKYKKHDEVMEETFIFISGKPGIDWKHYDRIELTADAGDYNITIHSITVNDTGAYTCIEDEGRGNIHPFWLQVDSPDRSRIYITVGASAALFAAILLITIFVILYLKSRCQKPPDKPNRNRLLQEPVSHEQVPRVVHTLPEAETVCGVTSLDDKLYVLRPKGGKDQVEVYNTTTTTTTPTLYSLLRHLSVPGLKSLTDMTSCKHYHCLYISDHSSKCVHRVELNGKVTKWSVNYKPRCLSVTSQCTVIVACYIDSKLLELTTEGKQLREINLLSDIVNPWHAIQLSNGRFVVCHGDVTDPVNRVCIVDTNGHVTQSYGGPPDSATAGQLNGPFHLAVDKAGFIFVADLNNSRVLLLSPTLNFVREIVSRDQFKWEPERLFLDVDRRLLYVTDNEWKDGKWTTGRVVVVQL